MFSTHYQGVDVELAFTSNVSRTSYCGSQGGLARWPLSGATHVSFCFWLQAKICINHSSRVNKNYVCLLTVSCCPSLTLHLAVTMLKHVDVYG